MFIRKKIPNSNLTQNLDNDNYVENDRGRSKWMHKNKISVMG